MKNLKSLIAVSTAAALTAGTLTAPLAGAEERSIAAHIVDVDATAQTCTITPDSTAKARFAAYGDAMWGDATRLVESTDLKYAESALRTLKQLAEAGEPTTNSTIGGWLTAIELPVALNGLADLSNTIAGTNGLLSLFIGAAEWQHTVTQSEEDLADIIKPLIINNPDADHPTYGPGVLSDVIVKPAITAHTPFTEEKISFEDAQAKAEEFRSAVEKPVYNHTLIRLEDDIAAVQSLSNGYLEAWKSYNQDGYNVYAACAAEEHKEEELEVVKPEQRDPIDIEGAGKLAAAGVASSQGDSSKATELTSSAIEGNEQSSKGVTIAASVLGVLTSLGLLAALLPYIKKALPADVARMLP